MTWVQTPGLTHFSYYFFTWIPMQHNIEDPPCTSKSAHPRVPEHPHQRQGLGNMLRFSQMHHTGSKKSMDFKQMGQAFQICTSNSGVYPPWFAHLIYFLISFNHLFQLLYYFNYLFYLIFFFLIKIQKHHKNKKDQNKKW